MKTFIGTVTSTSMDKTIVVQVIRMWMHPKYKKTVKRTKKYLVHDPKGQAEVKDNVEFSECRPVSKRKRFQLVQIISDETSKKASLKKEEK